MIDLGILLSLHLIMMHFNLKMMHNLKYTAFDTLLQNKYCGVMATMLPAYRNVSKRQMLTYIDFIVGIFLCIYFSTKPALSIFPNGNLTLNLSGVI